MFVILESSGYEKLDKNKKNIIDKGIKKLDSLINNFSNFKEYTVNNPVIHDSYGDFYVYKYITKSFSVRILYRYNTMLEIHKFHFKKGDRDNSKYIEIFENYASEFRKEGKYGKRKKH